MSQPVSRSLPDPQHDGVRCPFGVSPAEALLDPESVHQFQPGTEESIVVAVLCEKVVACEYPQQLVRAGVLGNPIRGVRVEADRRSVTAAQHDHARVNPLDAQPVVVGQPPVEGLAEGFGPPPQDRVPRTGVLQCRHRVQPDHDDVATPTGEPVEDRRHGMGGVGYHPVAQHTCESPAIKPVGDALQHLFGKQISFAPAVPKEEGPVWRHDERRVGDDQIEPLLADRLEPGSLPPLNIAGLAQNGAEFGEG